MNVAPTIIRPNRASNISHSRRVSRWLSVGSNILLEVHQRWRLLCRSLAFHDCLVDLAGNRRACAAAGTFVRARRHDHCDRIPRILVRSVRDKPRDRFFRESRGASLSANLEVVGYRGSASGAFWIFHIGKHSLAQSVESALADSNLAAHNARRELNAVFGAHICLRLDSVHQPRLQNGSAV